MNYSIGVFDCLVHMALAAARGLRRCNDNLVSPWTVCSLCVCESDKAMQIQLQEHNLHFML